MRVKVVILFYIVFFSATAHAALLPDTTIQHEQVSSFLAGQRLLIEAQLNDSKGVNAARCYFKAGGNGNYLYVPMQRVSGNRFQSVFPSFTEGTGVVEYFFLVVNGSQQVIRSTPYTVNETGNNDLSQQQNTIDPSATLQVYSELGVIDKEDTAVIDDWVDLLPTPHGDQLFGLRAGVYEEAVLPDSLHYMPGFFGGFIVDATDNAVIRPIKGFAVRLAQDFTDSKSVMGMKQQGAHPEQKAASPPDIAGDDWVGYFVDGASGIKRDLTATVVVEDSSVSIETSLKGLGYYLKGKLYDNGDLFLIDSYDGEDWTTHYGPATELNIGIYDYIYHPHPDEPPPPLNAIVLYRPPQPPSEVLASDGTFKEKTVVSWNSSFGALYYEVYTCSSSLTDSCTILSQVNTTVYDDTRRLSGVRSYRIKACSQVGCGEFSDSDTGYSSILVTPMLYLLL